MNMRSIFRPLLSAVSLSILFVFTLQPASCESLKPAFFGNDFRTYVPSDVYSTPVTSTKPNSIQVRVLLDEGANGFSCNCSADGGFVLADPQNGKKKIVIEGQKLELVFKNDHLYINNKRLTRDDVVIKACTGNILFKGKSYEGSFYAVAKNGKFLLINCLDLEDYVCSVLHFESWPTWPKCVNKVLAIAARTYVVAMIKEAARCRRLYHVRNSVIHQVYAGTHNDKNIRRVVEKTRGKIMIYDDNPIIAMYHACCGGVVPAHMKGIDFRKAPYLARTVACKYCCRCKKVYEWRAEFKKADLAKILKEYVPCLGTIVSMQITKKDRAGLVREVAIKGKNGIVTVSGKIISKLPRIKSFFYFIQNTSQKIIFKGRGFGNHAGLCQWGAREMARDGYSHKQILRFYYPGIKFVTLVPS